MRENLVISCVGPTSLHKYWLNDDRNFDIFLIYYGDQKKLYEKDSEYYLEKKGTKFNNIYDIKLPKDYNYIFVPDDDLLMETHDINRIFQMSNEYDLWICQPSLIGYYSVVQTLHQPDSVLRYTNWVEIMCPCFSKNAFNTCKTTFNYSKSCWGIEKLWDKLLGHPEDKIAILDDVVIKHTRPCFSGDNYSNNKIEKPELDLHKVIQENNLEWKIKEYKKIIKNIDNIPSNLKHHPPLQFSNQKRRLF